MLNSSVKTKDGKESITAYTVNELPKLKVEFKKKYRNRKVYQYAEHFITLDTETSHTSSETWIYQWACKFNNTYIYGRKPSEIISLLEKLKEYYSLSNMKKITIYVHNLSYDITFLKHYLYEYDNNMQVLATDAHNYLIVDVEGFRFICSWKLSSLSLDLFSKTYAEKYRKAVGEIDYSILHYQDEELSDSDWYYMFSDVASQYDAILGLCKAQGYSNYFDMPYTSTGFVRTDCRRASEVAMNWRKNFKRSQLQLDQYKLLRQAFMGGLTICSWLYADTTVRGDLGHKDFTSSYPARQMMNYFPKGAPTWFGDIEDQETFNSLLDTYCCVFILHAYKVEIKKGVTAPCIPSSKCIFSSKETLKLNGKVVYSDELAIAITEIDYKWIKRQYNIESFEVSNMLIFQRGQLPTWLKSQIMKYFEHKNTLKHADPRLYMASKGKLNGIYGMTATAIIRQSYEYNDDLILEKKIQDDQKELDKFYNSRNSFMPYQYSVYTTAWARDALLTMIECVGYENFLYCDTDSVFYIKTDEGEKQLAEYNEMIKQKAIDAGAYIGNSYLGYATDEAKLRAFRGLHAKCYAVEELNEKTQQYELHVTIAGITKKATKWVKGDGFNMCYTMSNAEELGNIDNLKDGFIFKHNGGTRAIYIEEDKTHITINGHQLETSGGVIIENIEKEINDTMFTVGENYEILHINPYETL